MYRPFRWCGWTGRPAGLYSQKSLASLHVKANHAPQQSSSVSQLPAEILTCTLIFVAFQMMIVWILFWISFRSPFTVKCRWLYWRRELQLTTMLCVTNLPPNLFDHTPPGVFDGQGSGHDFYGVSLLIFLGGVCKPDKSICPDCLEPAQRLRFWHGRRPCWYEIYSSNGSFWLDSARCKY